jgi:hypothetical protein
LSEYITVVNTTAIVLLIFLGTEMSAMMADIGTPAPVPRVHPHPVIERLQTRALKLLYFRMETSRAVKEAQRVKLAGA